MGEEKPTPKISKITINSQIVACLDNTPVDTIIWEKSGGNNIPFYDGYGSERPGVLEIGNRKYNNLEVEVEVKGIDLYKYPTLSGELSFVLPNMKESEKISSHTKLQGILKDKVDSKDKVDPKLIFEVFPDPIPGEFYRLHGLVRWTLKYKTNESLDYKTEPCEPYAEGDSSVGTYLEIFWIYGYPGKMYKKGVWIEVLRLLDIECFGLDNKKDIIGKVVNFCFSSTDLKYDDYNGMCHYVTGWFGGRFDLEAYLEKMDCFCNCYDQAGAVQTLLGALGIDINWQCISPFGYLKATNLIGRGLTNNPFLIEDNIKENDECKYIQYMHGGVLSTNDPRRTRFGEHGFCTWDNGDSEVVLDACAGPFIGNHTIPEYLEQCIDIQANLYSPFPGNNFNPARTRDINTCAGVTDVHSLPSIPDIPEDKENSANEPQVPGKATNIALPRSLFIPITVNQKLLFFARGTDQCKNEKNCVGLNIESVRKILETPEYKLTEDKSKGWRKWNRFRCGIDISAEEWTFIKPNKHLYINISVANNIKSARNLFLMMASSSTRSGIPFKIEKKGEKEEKNEQHAYMFSPYYNISMWWYCNVFIKMFSYNYPHLLFEKIFQKLKEVVTVVASTNEDLSKSIHDMDKIFKVELVNPYTKIHTDNNIHTGDELMLTISFMNEPKRCFSIDFFLAGDSLKLLKENPKTGSILESADPATELTFKGRTPGFTGVGLVIVDRNTLLCSRPHWEMINVS